MSRRSVSSVASTLTIHLSTLQSLGLPGAITALERPTSLPPALLKKAEEIYEEGGLEKVQQLMSNVMKLGQADSAIIEEVRLFAKCVVQQTYLLLLTDAGPARSGSSRGRDCLRAASELAADSRSVI